MKTWWACLLGRRSAILKLAGSRATFLAGLLLLFSAGIAREYDDAFLPFESPYLLIPFAVSTAMGLVLWLAFFLRGRKQPGAISLPSFLGVFWMSAPLAWLYGIPYERFLSPLAAAHANLWTLALVSLWRVAWVTRVIAVLHGSRMPYTLVRVLFCADVVVFVVACLAPQPVQDFMGGIRGSPVEQLAGEANWSLIVFSVLAFPVLGLLALVTARRIGRQRFLAQSSPRSRDVVRFASIATVVWLLLALPAQPEQYRRWSVERDLRAGRIEPALAAMSARAPDDFPPHWDPPPHPYFRDDEPAAASVLSVMMQQPVASWVAERFVPKLFQVYYGELDSSASMIVLLAADWAKNHGEEEGRRRLEFVAAHGGMLTTEERRSVDDLLAEARSGAPLYVPQPETQ